MKDYTIESQMIYQIVGAAIEVHKHLGSGFLEDVYQAALQVELKKQNIPFEAQVRIPVYYKGEKLDKYYIADLICFDEIIVELKALTGLTSSHIAQTVNYLKATGLKHGLILNFGSIKLEHRHCVCSHV